MTKVEITTKEYEDLQRSQAKLNALEAGGVDNWEWYDESLSDYYKEERLNELVADWVESLNDLMTEAEVDEPAGRGCGYSIQFDESSVVRMLHLFLKEANEND